MSINNMSYDRIKCHQNQSSNFRVMPVQEDIKNIFGLYIDIKVQLDNTYTIFFIIIAYMNFRQCQVSKTERN